MKILHKLPPLCSSLRPEFDNPSPELKPPAGVIIAHYLLETTRLQMKDTQSARHRLSKEDRRKQILICAVRVFARSNYKRARVSDIASEIGITEAAIYKHFPSKKTIFEEILDHIHQQIIQNWEQAREKSVDALDLLENMSLLYFRKMSKHPDELKVQFQAVSEADDKDIARKLRTHHRDYRKFIQSVLAQGIEEGVIRANIDQETIAHVFDAIGAYMNMMTVLGERDFSEKRSRKIARYLLSDLMPVRE